MKTSKKIIITAAICLLSAQTASAVYSFPGYSNHPNVQGVQSASSTMVNGPINAIKNSPHRLASTTVAIGQTNTLQRLESLQKEYARLTELIAKLKEQLGKTASSTIATQAELDCAKPAVTARETAVATAYTAFAGCTTGALSVRKTALENAWGIAANNERNNSIGKAWEEFNKTRKECQNTYKTAVKTAWDTFKTTIKTCKLNSSEGMREGGDQSL